jgi:ABC-type transporter Mla subunit MlaD
MKEFLKKIWQKIYERRSVIFLAFNIVVLFFAGRFVYNHLFKFYVNAKFEDVPPTRGHLDVYYKGFRVGTTAGIKPGPGFQYSIVKLAFNTNISDLPDNVTVRVKKSDDSDESKGKFYVQLVYPHAPSLAKIKRGATIDGQMEQDINSFMAEQLESGALGNISGNMASTLNSAKKASDDLDKMINIISGVITDVRPNIVTASKNLAGTTQNLNDMSLSMSELTAKLNLSATKEKTGDIVTNIDEITQNINEVTQNLNRATKNLDKTMEKVDTAIMGVNVTIDNTNNITSGLYQTLSRRFGGTRLIFGKAIDAKQPTGAARPVCPTD